jgi:hypothetical protein
VSWITGAIARGQPRRQYANPGAPAAFEYLDSNRDLGAERNWQRAQFGIGTAVRFYQDVLWLAAAGGSRLGSNLPADRRFGLGGPASLPGYELYELRAGAYWTISGSYLWQIKDISTLRGQTERQPLPPLVRLHCPIHSVVRSLPDREHPQSKPVH